MRERQMKKKKIAPLEIDRLFAELDHLERTARLFEQYANYELTLLNTNDNDTARRILTRAFESTLTHERREAV
jgi:hypothetical protein